MGSDESHFNVSLIVRDKVTRKCPQIIIVLKRMESRSGIEPSWWSPLSKKKKKKKKVSNLVFYAQSAIAVISGRKKKKKKNNKNNTNNKQNNITGNTTFLSLPLSWMNLNYNPCKIKFSSSSSLSLSLSLSPDFRLQIIHGVKCNRLGVRNLLYFSFDVHTIIYIKWNPYDV